jgi:hypothetical protein
MLRVCARRASKCDPVNQTTPLARNRDGAIASDITGGQELDVRPIPLTGRLQRVFLGDFF